MNRSWIWMFGLLVPTALGCGRQEQDTASAQPPQAVAPVEVTPDEGADGEDDLVELRARVAELEAQIAACGCPEAAAETGTQTAPIPQDVAVPEGVEVPDDVEAPEAARAEAAEPTERTEPGEDSDTPTARRRQAREPTLLGTLLGDEEEAERERQRARRQAQPGDEEQDDRLELPNPARVLFGE